MALKDWKEGEHSSNDDIIWNKGESTVQVTFITSPNIGANKYKWLVSTWTGDESNRKNKWADTKAQAITAAKNYMRTH